MAEPLEIFADTYQALAFDLPAAIATYQAELDAFATTEGVPAPSASSLVEGIVKHHDGKFVIVPPPPVPDKQPLPRDPSYYRTPAEQADVIAAAEAVPNDQAITLSRAELELARSRSQ
jgi:hypothetical protein